MTLCVIDCITANILSGQCQKNKSIVWNKYMMKVKTTPASSQLFWLFSLTFIIFSPCHSLLQVCNEARWWVRTGKQRVRTHSHSGPIIRFAFYPWLRMKCSRRNKKKKKNLGLQLSGLFMCCCRERLDLLISLMLPSLHYFSSIFLTQPPQVVVSWCK